VKFRGATIAGLSGIYKRFHYNRGHHERLPYIEDTKRSIYHVREFDVHKLSLLKQPTILMSHDWPRGIHQYGDHRSLLARKPYFKHDIEKGELGSEPAEMLLKKLTPRYWFSAHLHIKFTAFVDHDAINKGGEEDEEGEIVLEDSDDELQDTNETSGKRTVSPSVTDSESKRQRQDIETSKPSTSNRTTRFLALDKCLPRREFLQILDIETDANSSSNNTFAYDPRWLAITKTFHSYLSTTIKPNSLPSDEELQAYIPTFPMLIQSNRGEFNMGRRECKRFVHSGEF
jgi:lariat debranching enzyme